MFMWYLGGRIGHRATHLASSAVSSEELGDKTSNWEESGGGDSEKGRNQPQGGDLEFEEDKDERYGYGNEDEEEEEGEMRMRWWKGFGMTRMTRTRLTH